MHIPCCLTAHDSMCASGDLSLYAACVMSFDTLLMPRREQYDYDERQCRSCRLLLIGPSARVQCLFLALRTPGRLRKQQVSSFVSVALQCCHFPRQYSFSPAVFRQQSVASKAVCCRPCHLQCCHVQAPVCSIPDSHAPESSAFPHSDLCLQQVSRQAG